ncbi:MAG: M48 family metallopeptidase [Actinomycetota bacterium]
MRRSAGRRPFGGGGFRFGGSGASGLARFVIPVIMAVAAGGFLWFTAEKQDVPVTGREQRVNLSDQQQIRLGHQVYEQMLRQEAAAVIDSGPDFELVQRVAERIAAVGVQDKPEFEWEFTVIDDPQINAFCLPGGKIVVYTGVLSVAETEAGLATVIGHEVAHATGEQGAERIFQQQLTGTAVQIIASGAARDRQEYEQIAGLLGAGAAVGLSLPWSRDQGSEADHIGLVYMARAGYHPEEAVGFWERMDAATRDQPRLPEYLSTHPSSETRIDQIRGWLPEALEEYRTD